MNNSTNQYVDYRSYKSIMLMITIAFLAGVAIFMFVVSFLFWPELKFELRADDPLLILATIFFLIAFFISRRIPKMMTARISGNPSLRIKLNVYRIFAILRMGAWEALCILSMILLVFSANKLFFVFFILGYIGMIMSRPRHQDLVQSMNLRSDEIQALEQNNPV